MEDRLFLSAENQTKTLCMEQVTTALGQHSERRHAVRFSLFKQRVATATLPGKRLEQGFKTSQGASDDDLDARHCPREEFD